MSTLHLLFRCGRYRFTLDSSHIVRVGLASESEHMLADREQGAKEYVDLNEVLGTGEKSQHSVLVDLADGCRGVISITETQGLMAVNPDQTRPLPMQSDLLGQMATATATGADGATLIVLAPPQQWLEQVVTRH